MDVLDNQCGSLLDHSRVGDPQVPGYSNLPNFYSLVSDSCGGTHLKSTTSSEADELGQIIGPYYAIISH